ncbi:MAG: HEPN domain-containing protein [Phycisphaerales bacterium]|nr:HEPN domain-containing protein [Phycisphaerales bacterium]
MKPQCHALLVKAERAIHAAIRLKQDGDLDFAAGRAYYAMFYVAEALLFERGLTFRKHSGVHTAFGEHFAKSGAMDSRFHRHLLDAFDKRLQADYGFEAVLDVEDVDAMIAHAGEFLATARAFFERSK